MAWKKSTEAQIERFYIGLPDDPRVRRVKMFGMPLGRVGDYNFAGCQGGEIMVRVSQTDCEALLAQGGKLWEPMPGRPRPDCILLPESISRDPKELAAWVRKAFEHALGLPPRVASRSKKKVRPSPPPKRQTAKVSKRKKK